MVDAIVSGPEHVANMTEIWLSFVLLNVFCSFILSHVGIGTFLNNQLHKDHLWIIDLLTDDQNGGSAEREIVVSGIVSIGSSTLARSLHNGEESMREVDQMCLPAERRAQYSHTSWVLVPFVWQCWGHPPHHRSCASLYGLNWFCCRAELRDADIPNRTEYNALKWSQTINESTLKNAFGFYVCPSSIWISSTVLV